VQILGCYSSIDCTNGVRFGHEARKMKACTWAQCVRETRSGVSMSAGLSEGRRRAGAAVRAVAIRPKKKRRGSRAGQREKEKARIWACSGQIQTEWEGEGFTFFFLFFSKLLNPFSNRVWIPFEFKQNPINSTKIMHQHECTSMYLSLMLILFL